MKKIINTFKYGSGATKRLLALTLLAGIVAFALAIAAVVSQSLLFFFGAVICVFITISLAQTFGIHEEDEGISHQSKIHQEVVQKGDTKTDSPDMTQEEQEQTHVQRMSEEVAKKVKVKATKFESIKKTKKLDRKKKPDGQPKPKKVKADKAVLKACKERNIKRKKAIRYVMKQQETGTVRAEKEVKLDRMKSSKRKNTKNKTERLKAASAPVPSQTKQSTKKNQETKRNDDPYGIFGDITESTGTVGDGISATADLIGMSDYSGATLPDDKAKKIPLTEEEKMAEMKSMQASDEEIAQYNRTKVKKLLRKYKVKRDHRLVLIDQCEKYSIYQTPAYMWVADKMLHLLLIEKEPRHLTIPTYNIHELTYLKKQLANEDIDYAAFKGKSVLAELFRPYLPDYTHSTVVDDLSAYKNLYGIGPGIYFTNRSASSLLDLLAVEFVVVDKVTTSNKANVYFKDAYKSYILLRDNVVDANGYADRISRILDSMAHSAISYEEFKDTLNLMQKNKLITEEFALYYMGVRDKN